MFNHGFRIRQDARIRNLPCGDRGFWTRFCADESGDFGLSSLIGVAIGLIIAAFVLIPGIRDFAGRVIAEMDNWWRNSVSTQVFPK